jgi:two-component system chemotaxis response regulator CheB
MCRLLTSCLTVAPDFQVVGTTHHGARALEMVRTLRPNVIALGLALPDMSGLDVLDKIMHECPTPVVLISGTSREAAALTLQGLNMGAVDFIQKHTPGTEPDILPHGLAVKVRAAARIRVIRSLHVRRTPSREKGVGAQHVPPSQPTPQTIEPVERLSAVLERVVVIGASTGGPTAIRELLSGLPANFAAAVIVVQHMPDTFTTVLAAQLDRAVPLRVREAVEGDRLQPGTVLVAPGGFHLIVGADARIQLTQEPEVGGHRPAIDVTMQSVAQRYGARSEGVVLTGMGSDGAMGLQAIRAHGGMTFAQDAASCVVDGMPQQAVATGAVDYIGTPSSIAQRLLLGPRFAR